jgi:hypothetical protein
MDQFTIGYLSWNKYELFKKTLITHKKNGLFDIILPENRIIFFQEMSDNDIKLANEFECKYIGNSKNIGILNAYLTLLEECKTKYFIFCENDFILMDNNDYYSINKCLEDCVEIFSKAENAQIKLSNIKNPGFLYSKPKDVCNWLSSNKDTYTYKIESLSWIDEPEIFYKNIYILQCHYKWYYVKYSDQKWSNHIYVCNTEYLKTYIVPLLKYYLENNLVSDIIYQGLEDVLNNPEKLYGIHRELNTLINNFKSRLIFSGGGNFYHNKI